MGFIRMCAKDFSKQGSRFTKHCHFVGDCGLVMDRLMTYCAQPSDDDSVEVCVDYSPTRSVQSGVQYFNDYDCDNGQSDFERDLIKKCDNYRAQIKRQEEEINSYRQHIEVIEDEYSRLSSHLSVAEKNIRQNEKQLCSYQETIGSLKNELDSFYNYDEKSLHETNSPLSDVSLSFSNDSNLKVCCILHILVDSFVFNALII